MAYYKNCIRRAPILFACILLLMACPSARAEVGSVITLTDNTLKCTVDARWTSPVSYWPLRITLTPLASANDRSLKFVCQFNSQPVTSRYLFVPAGSTKPISLTVPVLCNGNGNLTMHIEDGGIVLPSTRNTVQNYNAYNTIEEGSPAVLYVRPSIPAYALAPPWLDSTVIGSGSAANSTNLKADELPDGWVSYSGLDIIVIQATGIAKLADEFPERWEAIRKWCAAGGNLVITGAGGTWEHLSTIESHLELPPLTSSEDIDPVARGWDAPTKETDSTVVIKGPATAQVPPSPPTIGPTPPPEFEPGVLPPAVADPDANLPGPVELVGARKPKFFLRAYGQGRVAVFGISDPNVLESHAIWLLNSLGTSRWLWYERQGLSTNRENHDFWNFLIPGVGLPPVMAFQVLITLFVIVIGPLNFWWLKRKRKLPLLILTIPLFAMTLSTMLLGYFVARDGFSTRARTRNVTLLDQGRKEAVCWSRHSYYCGMTPGKSLEFDGDVAAIPYYDIFPAANHRQPQHNLELAWQPDFELGVTDQEPTQQQFQGGWIRPRTPFQMMCICVRPSERRLDVETTDGGIRVSNKLGSDILALWLCDEQGNFHILKQDRVAEESDATLAATDLAAVMLDLNRKLEPSSPQLPADINIRRSRYRYNSYGPPRQVNAPTNVNYSTSRLEQPLVQLASRRKNEVKNWLMPRTYVAIIRHDPDVPNGYPGAKNEASLHVTIGNW